MATENERQFVAGQIMLHVDMSNGNVAEWKSNEKMIGGFKWCFKGQKIDAEQLSISICCNEDCCLNQLWLAKVDYSLESPDFQNVNVNDAYFFNGYDHEHIIKMFWPNKKCNVNLILTIYQDSSKTKITAFDTVLRFSFPAKSSNNKDDIFVKDDENKNVEKVFAVNKYLLAGSSGYFRNLFFGNWSEQSNSNSFVIKEEANFSIKAFAIMVYSSMAVGCAVHESGILHSDRKETLAMEILKLSIKYDIPLIQKDCEVHLIQSEKCPKMELLELADQLGLQKLAEHALCLISEEFGRFAVIRAQLSEKTRNELDKIFKE